MTFAESSPAFTRFEYSVCLSAIRPPHVKHLTGVSISSIFHRLSIIKTIADYSFYQKDGNVISISASCSSAIQPHFLFVTINDFVLLSVTSVLMWIGGKKILE